MNTPSKDLCKTLILSRHQNPAWQLLASRRAPLIISCLKPLFESGHDAIRFEDAEQHLAEMLAEHANNTEFLIDSEDYRAIARKELRDWIKRQLIIERDGKLIATDALQQALQFVGTLQNRMMTSTASRLSTVQREIENLDTLLNPDPKSRTDHLTRKLKAFEEELAQIQLGNVPTLKGAKAVESIREVYNLAMSLRTDFRRVEDSYREADRQLRQSIITEQHHRGEVVDKLLDSHDDLLKTAEGQVFHNFYAQLSRSVELDTMKHQLRNILENPITESALNPQQKSELRKLTIRLVQESLHVIQARARSEHDVKSFLKTGLAAEHHRIGQLLNDIFETAIDIDWQHAKTRRTFSPIPPVAVVVGNLPLIERLRFKTADEENTLRLELTRKEMEFSELGDDFWEAFDTLDRQALIQNTLNLLTKTGATMSIVELSQHLPPTHDLESLTLWLSMAMAGEVPIYPEQESLVLTDKTGNSFRFHIPKIALCATALQNVAWEV
jgi:hypothetical protein